MAHSVPASVHYFGSVVTDWNPELLGVIVPQTVYTEGQPLPTLSVVRFPPGIRLTEALRLAAGHGFDGRPPTTPRDRARLTLRLMWPGYPPWSTNLNVRERNQAADPIPLYRLIKRIAESVQSFYQQMGNVPFDHVAGSGWHLTDIPFERLCLLELRQVSTGSWQPVLSLL